jgi:hypothetical protein
LARRTTAPISSSSLSVSSAWAVGEQPLNGGEDVLEGGGEARIERRGHRVDPGDELRTVFIGDAHQIGDRLKRHLLRDIGDEVDLSLLERHVDDVLRQADEVLLEGGDDLGREGAADDLAIATVVVALEGEHGRLAALRRVDRVEAPDVDEALSGRVGLDVPISVHHVLVAREEVHPVDDHRVLELDEVDR